MVQGLLSHSPKTTPFLELCCLTRKAATHFTLHSLAMLLVFVLVTLFFVAGLGMSGPIAKTPPVFIDGVASTAMSTKPLSRRDSPKYVVAHFMVGNTYPYNQQSWLSDILLAHQNGIDGFALNVGRDPWQPQQVAYA